MKTSFVENCDFNSNLLIGFEDEKGGQKLKAGKNALCLIRRSIFEILISLNHCDISGEFTFIWVSENKMSVNIIIFDFIAPLRINFFALCFVFYQNALSFLREGGVVSS